MRQSPAPSKRRRFTAVILGAAVVVALLDRRQPSADPSPVKIAGSFTCSAQ
jgi:hypothetical protein